MVVPTYDTAGDAIDPAYSPQDLTLYDDTKWERVGQFDYRLQHRPHVGRRNNTTSIFKKAIIRNMSILMREYLNARSSTEVLVCDVTYRISNCGRITNVSIIQSSPDVDFDNHVKDSLSQVRLLMLSAPPNQEYRTTFNSLELKYKEEPQRITPGAIIDWSKPVLCPDIF